ncbi:MAG: hypothetical protein JRI23_19200 [Deltaproteobacteria bacterium]|jgi:hypothetical protein|nr:hypothetical protein [Deltaproteobacteria bacterium]MBW2533993.1 hypothetical protein [Deltaproteobacteria bacterium]
MRHAGFAALFSRMMFRPATGVLDESVLRLRVWPNESDGRCVVGPLPAMARALYEVMDGIEVDAKKAADRFVVYPPSEALADVRAHDRKYAPRTSPRDLVPPFLFPVAPDAYEKAGFSDVNPPTRRSHHGYLALAPWPSQSR